MAEKGAGRGRGPWTAKGVQASQEERLAALEAEVEALSAAVFGEEPPAEEPPVE
jgi:hypothetical protein